MDYKSKEDCDWLMRKAEKKLIFLIVTEKFNIIKMSLNLFLMLLKIQNRVYRWIAFILL